MSEALTAAEIRERILSVVSRNGGHLASSLGAVELAMALADVFEPTRDRVVWDVGHQAYAWKILTGRNESFDTLRRLDGVAPFPSPLESPADAAVSGHAGSALSVALGLAAARDRAGTGHHVVAVVGDASMANGASFEAINNCAAATRRLIVVLNDNDMAISHPAGSLARFFGRLTSGVRYNRMKKAAKRAGRLLRLSFLYGFVHGAKNRLKAMVLKNVYFEQFGLHYLGPVDGHDLAALKSALMSAREEERPVLLHVVTKKGRGYAPAERSPTRWHGVSPFDLAGTGRAGEDACTTEPFPGRPSSQADTWSDAFGTALGELARGDERVMALTAGMKDGTGLVDFAREFPGRFVDVGIAEAHMVSFAAGLAAGGRRPFVAVYSTFLQRAVDQVMHDVCIANLPVVFCVDRAGVVGADGATHQGLYDIALLRCLPNLTICQPKDADDLKALMREALVRSGPTVIRYPRGKVSTIGETAEVGRLHVGAADLPVGAADLSVGAADLPVGAADLGRAVPPRFALWATGDWYPRACDVAARLGGVAVHARYLKPFDAKLLADQRAAGMKIVSLENGCVIGGLGEALNADLRLGWPDSFIPHGAVADLEKRYGLDVESLVRRIAEAVPATTHLQPQSQPQPPTST